MSKSPNLSLPYILAAQAQKHVTHNEAIRSLDALVQLSVLDRDLPAPPAIPLDGARYIVAAAAEGVWSGQLGKIATYQDGVWVFYAPRTGWLAWVADEGFAIIYDGTAWIALAGGGSTSLNPTDGALVGINTTADTTNRLALKSEASLFDNVGNGHQQKINKAAAGDSASQLYQTNYSGRAEIGLTADDDFHFKVSPDGLSWKDAMRIDRTTGVVSLPFTPLGVQPNLLINGDFVINQRAFAFGALADGVYGVDRWKASGATDIGWDAATLTITLNAGAIQQLIETAVWGYASLASQQVTVSVEGLTRSNLTVAVGSVSGVITPGSGRRSVTLTLGAGDTGNLAVTLTPASYPTWWKRAKLEVGASATAWQARDAQAELRLCQRYLPAIRNISGTNELLPGVGTTWTQSLSIAYLPFSVPPQTKPSGVTVSATSTFVIAGLQNNYTPSSVSLYTSGPNGARLLMGYTSLGAEVASGVCGVFLAGGGYILFTGCEL